MENPFHATANLKHPPVWLITAGLAIMWIWLGPETHGLDTLPNPTHNQPNPRLWLIIHIHAEP
jgi:hypothetical protein